VVTWNVHELFDALDVQQGPGHEDTVPTAAQVEAKLAAIARPLAELAPDIVVLQEVETRALLVRLATHPLLAGRLPAVYLEDGNDPRGIDIGVMAASPLSAWRSHREDRDPSGGLLWSRDCVEVRFTFDGHPFVLFGNHFVSRRLPRDSRRQRQAQGVADYAQAVVRLEPGATVLVAGDLNDEPDSPTLAPLLGLRGFVDLGADLASSDRWTYRFQGRLERIDYILMGGATQWQREIAVAPVDAVASDHRPVVLDLWLH
jgi:endonuclease/exonuclease/phosphatase family metal-dependent hydrolase